MSETYPENSMRTLKTNGRFEKVTYDSRDHQLLANIYMPTDDPDDVYPGVFIVHGGGLRGKSTFKRLQRRLRNNGIASFAYDAPGTGGSEGDRLSETLDTRLADAQKSLEIFRERVRLSKLGALGMSMGADAAIRLTDSENIAALTLLSPAAYPDELRENPLHLGFTQQIRRHTYDWSEESTFSVLEEYKGPSMVVYGSQDRIIPEDVQDKYREILDAGNPQNEFVVLDQATHNFLRPHTDAEARIRGAAITQVARFSITHFRPDETISRRDNQ